MKDRPGWIEFLFKSGIGLGCFERTHALRRQDRDKSYVQLIISDDANRAEELREASLESLSSDDEQTVERALVYLIVVGRPEDVSRVNRLLRHSSKVIKKGANTCRFELMQKQNRSGEEH